MNPRHAALHDIDPQVAGFIEREVERQETQLEMIASENFASDAILEATGSALTNKYAEGYPGKRYYGGCEFVDEIERIAIERAKRLFGAEHANVQPHSGSTANQAVYLTAAKPYETILGMSLAHGGHLTHGHPVNFSGKIYKIVSYGVDLATGIIDYDAIEKTAREARPKLIISGASAYPRRIDFARFDAIAREVGALHLADMAHYAGLVAADLYPSPIPHADFVTTTTHKTLRGPRSGLILCRAARAPAVDKAIFPGLQGGPLMHVVAAKAVCFGEAMTGAFKEYQREVLENARTLAAGLLDRGYSLVSGGTDCHLVLLDLRKKPVTGREAEAALEEAGITANKNAVPGDTRSSTVTSGLRLGTPALTTRGMKSGEMTRIAHWIADVLDAPGDRARIERIRDEIRQLAGAFPLHRKGRRD